MRKLIQTVLAVALLSPLGFAASGEEDLLKKILEEMQAVRRELSDLKNQVEALESKLETLTKERRGAKKAVSELEMALKGLEGMFPEEPKLDEERPSRRSSDLNALRSIRLPKDASRKQVEAYIREILEATRGQNTFSTDDPQIGMLARVGNEWLPLLVEAASTSHFTGGPFSRYHLNAAIKKIVKPKDRDLILRALENNRELVEIVVLRGWEEEAREVLIKGLKARSPNLPGPWITAVARLRDESTYELLKEEMIEAFNPHIVFHAIKDLPGIQLEETVAAAWHQKNTRHAIYYNDWSRREMAKVAVSYGHLDALEHLMRHLDEDDSGWASESTSRNVVLRHTTAKGSNEDIRKWFKANKLRLHFDKEKKVFSVAKAV